MSSKWVQVRDSIVDAMQVEEVGKELKDRFVGWAETEGINFIQAFADGVINECRKDAENESGWCRIRDGVILPVALNVGVYILTVVLTKSATAEIK